MLGNPRVDVGTTPSEATSELDGRWALAQVSELVNARTRDAQRSGEFMDRQQFIGHSTMLRHGENLCNALSAS